MDSRSEPGDTQEILRLISKISEAWLGGDTNRLNLYFHPRMTISGPDLRRIGIGRDACVKSYQDFIRQTTIQEYTESEPNIDLYGDTAVVVCPWTITYEMKGETYREQGRDLLVLVHRENGWLVAWRAVFPQAES